MATMESHRRVDALFSHFALDTQGGYRAFLRAQARALAPLERFAGPAAPRLDFLKQDLAALGTPMPHPLALAKTGGDAFRWGMLYALEGSRLGGAMLVRVVPEHQPRAYLSAVHEKGGWVAFQDQLDAAAVDGGDVWVEEAVRGAQAAFDLFAAAGRAELDAVDG